MNLGSADVLQGSFCCSNYAKKLTEIENIQKNLVRIAREMRPESSQKVQE